MADTIIVAAKIFIKSGMIKGKTVTKTALLNGICVTALYHAEPKRKHTKSEMIYEKRSIVFRCFLFFCAIIEIIAAIIGYDIM